MVSNLNDYQKNNDLRSKEMIKNLYQIMEKHYYKIKDDVALGVFNDFD